MNGWVQLEKVEEDMEEDMEEMEVKGDGVVAAEREATRKEWFER